MPILIAGMTILAFAIRIYQVGASSLWEDEITRILNSTIYAKDFFDVVRLASTQSQPPLSYWLNRIILSGAVTPGAGLSDTFARIPVVVYGTFTIPIFFFMVRELFGSPYDYFATFFLIISPLSVKYSQEVGSIALWLLFTIVETFLLVKAIRTKQSKYWTLTCIAMVLSIYTHIFAAFVIFLQVFVLFSFLVVKRIKPTWIVDEVNSQDFLSAFVSSLIAAFSFTPLIKLILSGSEQYMQGLDLAITRYAVIIFGAMLPFSSNATGLLFIFLITIIGLVDMFIRKRLEGALLIAMAIGLPIIEYIAFDYRGLPYFQARYVIPSLPFLIIAFIGGVNRIIWMITGLFSSRGYTARTVNNGLWFGSVILLSMMILPNLLNVYTPTKQNWRELTKFLENKLDGSDLLSFSPEYFYQYYNYYNTDIISKRKMYASIDNDAFVANIYWITNSNDLAQFDMLPTKPKTIAHFLSNLYLWDLNINKYLNPFEIINQDFSLKVTKGINQGWPVGWFVTGGGSLLSQQQEDKDTENLMKFFVESKYFSVKSLPFLVEPGKAVKMIAQIKTDHLNRLGAIVGLIIKDRHGSTVGSFKSDFIGGSRDWLHVIAGGIVPTNGYSAQLYIQNIDVPNEEATIWIKDIQLFVDWETKTKFNLLQEVEIPDFNIRVPVTNFWEFPQTNDTTLLNEFETKNKIDGIVALTTLSTGVDYFSSSLTLNLDTKDNGYLLFGVDVKTEELRRQAGFRNRGRMD